LVLSGSDLFEDSTQLTLWKRGFIVQVPESERWPRIGFPAIFGESSQEKASITGSSVITIALWHALHNAREFKRARLGAMSEEQLHQPSGRGSRLGAEWV
jgi:hypothetical protein